MVAGRGDVLRNRGAVAIDPQEAYLAPDLVIREVIERVARGDTRLASGARIEAHFERVLLTGAGAAGREQRAPEAGACDRAGVMRARELLDRAEARWDV